MSEPAAVPQSRRRKRLSKNKKKTWRTLSRDVDELLPQETKMEVAKRRSGGFFLDVGEPDAKRRARVAGSKSPLDGLRCHESLQALEEPGVESKRTRAFNERRLKRLTKAASAKTPKETKTKEEEAKSAKDSIGSYDIWEAEGERKALGLPVDRLAMGELLTHQLRSTGRQPVRRRVKTPRAALPACLVPACGASVNPSLEAHQRQLAGVQAEEDARLRAEEKLRNQLERHFPDAGVDLEARELREMSAGIFEDDEDEEDGESGEGEAAEKGEGEGEAEARTTAHSSAKDAKEARRQRAAAAERKRARRLAHELGQLPAVSKRVEAALANRSVREAAKLAKRLARASGTKRLARRKFEEVEEQFKMPAELTPSLRQLKPEGDLFVDAVKSLQRRNVLEPTERARWRPRYPPKRVGKKNRQPDRMREAE